jgi:MFS family permease
MAAVRPGVLLLLIIYLGFISLGLPDGTFGVAWPQAHAALGAPLGLGGTIVMIATLLAATAGFSSGAIIGRWGTGPVVATSCLFTGGALWLIANAGGVWGLVLAAVPLGLGSGAVDAGLNGYVARHYSGRHMNWLHACWGVGATAGPLVMAHALATGAGWRGGYFVLGAAQLALALVFLVTLRLWKIVPERPWPTHTASHPRPVAAAAANSPAGWLSAGIFLLYTAVEFTAGIWAGSILVIARGFPHEIAGWCTAAYFGSITVGRVAVGFIPERWPNRRRIATGMALALLGAVLFAGSRSPELAAIAMVLLGLGFAPVYPGLMHEVPRRFAPEAVQVVIGRQSGAACIGAAALPAATGWLAQHSLEGIPFVVIAGVLLLMAAIRRLDRIT